MTAAKRGIALLSVVSLMGILQPTHAFNVEGDHPVHERLTRDALNKVNRDYGVTMTPLARSFVISGNVNTDDTDGPHKWGSELNDYHVNNALNSNTQFVRSFTVIQNSLDMAVSLARKNLRFLVPDSNPNYIKTVLDSVCENAGNRNLCNVVSTPGVLHEGEYRTSDPHTSSYAANVLRLVEQMITEFESRNDATNVARLNNVRDELRAYRARQLIGHAFHTLQDTFAHSNFVELMHGKIGPPCLGNFPDRTDICSRRAIPAYPVTLRYGDPLLGEFYQMLGNGFAIRRATFRQALGSKASRFQTGSVLGDLEGGIPMKDILIQAFDSMESAGRTRSFFAALCPRSDEGDYCHWRGRRRPALNKDNPTNGDASHENFAPARRAALLASEIMWEHFLSQAELMPERVARLEVVSLKEGTLPEKKPPTPPKNLATQSLTNTKLRTKKQATKQKGPKGSFEVSKVHRPLITLHLQKRSRLNLRLTYDFRAASGARDGTSCSPGVDLLRQSGQLQIVPGQVSATIMVPLCPDSTREQPQNFRLRVTGGRLAPISQLFQIEDDDQPVILQAPKLKLPLKNQLPRSKVKPGLRK